MIPLSIFRQRAWRRPVAFLGQNSWRIGSIRFHNASGISQIVPSGWRGDLRRANATPPVATRRGRVSPYNLPQPKGVSVVLGQIFCLEHELPPPPPRERTTNLRAGAPPP